MIPELLLHHYTSGHGLLGIFEHGEIWATNVHSLNDTREFAHSIELAKSAIRSEISESIDRNKLAVADAIISHLESSSRISIYVTCFSEVMDSLSQWRGYISVGGEGRASSSPRFCHKTGGNGEE